MDAPACLESRVVAGAAGASRGRHGRLGGQGCPASLDEGADSGGEIGARGGRGTLHTWAGAAGEVGLGAGRTRGAPRAWARVSPGTAGSGQGRARALGDSALRCERRAAGDSQGRGGSWGNRGDPRLGEGVDRDGGLQPS